MDSNGHDLGIAPERVVLLHGGGRWDGGGAVADMAGEFGAELVPAIRVGLAQGAGGAYEPRGSSQLTWYAFAAEYARVHWPGRAAKTRDEVSEALTAVTLAMCWDEASLEQRPTRPFTFPAHPGRPHADSALLSEGHPRRSGPGPCHIRRRRIPPSLVVTERPVISRRVGVTSERPAQPLGPEKTCEPAHRLQQPARH